MAEVLDIIDHEDGSATISFDFTPEELKALLTYAVTHALVNSIKLDKRGILDESSYDLGGTD